MAEDARADDTTIPNTDRLFRRVRENQLVKLDDGSRRPSSAVFKDATMSVNIESLMIEQGHPPEDTLTGYPGEYLTCIIAGDVRAHGLRIVKQTDRLRSLLGRLTSATQWSGENFCFLRGYSLNSHQWMSLSPSRRRRRRVVASASPRGRSVVPAYLTERSYRRQDVGSTPFRVTVESKKLFEYAGSCRRVRARKRGTCRCEEAGAGPRGAEAWSLPRA